MEANTIVLDDESRAALIARLWKVVPERPEGQCWVPTLRARIKGYVPMDFRHVRTLVHRWMWVAYVGDPGPVLDHKVCDNKECCNPAHLEPATHRQNILRGSAPTATNALKTHCKRGHPFDEANTYVCASSNGGVRRICRACNSALTLRRYHQRRASVAR